MQETHRCPPTRRMGTASAWHSPALTSHLLGKGLEGLASPHFTEQQPRGGWSPVGGTVSQSTCGSANLRHLAPEEQEPQRPRSARHEPSPAGKRTCYGVRNPTKHTRPWDTFPAVGTPEPGRATGLLHCPLCGAQYSFLLWKTNSVNREKL